jgi:hypothetical protein
VSLPGFDPSHHHRYWKWKCDKSFSIMAGSHQNTGIETSAETSYYNMFFIFWLVRKIILIYRVILVNWNLRGDEIGKGRRSEAQGMRLVPVLWHYVSVNTSPKYFYRWNVWSWHRRCNVRGKYWSWHRRCNVRGKCWSWHRRCNVRGKYWSWHRHCNVRGKYWSWHRRCNVRGKCFGTDSSHRVTCPR